MDQERKTDLSTTRRTLQQLHERFEHWREMLVAVHLPVALAISGWHFSLPHFQATIELIVVDHEARQAGHALRMASELPSSMLR